MSVIPILRSTGCMSWFMEEEMHFLMRESERVPWSGPTNQVTAEGAHAAGWQVIDLRAIVEERDSLLGTIERLRARAEGAEGKLRQIQRLTQDKA